jgi:hypothetical protein
MKNNRNCALIVVLASGLSVVSAQAETVYSTIPGALPPNLPSLGYQANQTAEFGDLINLDLSSGDTSLSTVTVAMSDWAKKSDWPTTGTATGYNVDLTLNLYSVGAGNSVGASLGSETVNAFIPWRPEANAPCGTGYTGFDGNCYNGSLSTVTFDFVSDNITLPNQLIYGLAFNTTTWGANPTGVPGPYESLNFGLSTLPPTIGSNPFPDTAYWNTETAGDYADGGAGGVGTFRQDTAWAPYSGAIDFEATPEPGTFGLIGLGLAGLLAAARKRTQRI